MSARAWKVGCAIAIVATAGGFAWKTHHAEHRAAPGAGVAFAWPAGLELQYAVTWDEESALVLSSGSGATAAPMRGVIGLRSELRLRSYGQRDGRTIVGVALEHTSRHVLEALGADVLADDAQARATLEGHEAIAAIAPTGAVTSVAFAPDAPETFRMIAAKLLPLAMVTLREDGVVAGTWSASEAGPAGSAHVRYVADESDGGLAISRTRESYDALDALPPSMRAGARAEVTSHGGATLDARGWVTSVHDDERVTAQQLGSAEPALVQTTKLVTELVRVGRFASPVTPPSDAELETSMRPRAIQEDDTRALEGRVGALTFAELRGDLLAYGVLGHMPNQNRWVFRAAGLVLLHPEVAGELAAAFEDRKATSATRSMVMDVLASAGSAEAQQAMRDALHTKGLDTKERALLVQRFSFVHAPDAASVAFLQKEASDADVTTRSAGLYALGSATGKLAKSGHTADVTLARAQLDDALVRAKTRDAKRTALSALGNAGIDEDARAIARYATDDADDSVRSAAVRALRKDTGDDARAAIAAAVEDPSPAVESAAIQVLAVRADPDDIARLADAVLAGRTARATDADLVNAIAAQAATSPAARRMLAYVLDRTGDDLELASRVRGILGATVAVN